MIIPCARAALAAGLATMLAAQPAAACSMILWDNALDTATDRFAPAMFGFIPATEAILGGAH